ncbi:hypothetical protein ACP70R_000040 [Stipagrostis hirtigluma subsp. patula]
MGRGRPRQRHRARAGEGGEAAGEEPALFPLGAEVEVRSDDPGFVGSFYEATVAGYLPSGRGYVVAYSTLTRREDGGGSPVRELAAADDVRPRPPAAPPSAPREFAMHEMVEAFHNEGWWEGVVCGVPPVVEAPAAAGVPPRRVYTVSFPTSREVLEFEETALRPHRVFRGERWVPAAEAENGTPMFREGSQVEVSGSAKTFGEYWNPATVKKVIGATSFLVQYSHVRDDGELATEILDSQYIRPARNIIRMDSKYRFTPSSHAEVFHEDSWWPGVILEVLDDNPIKKYVVKIKSRETNMDEVEDVDMLTVEHTQLRPRYDWYGKKWVRHLTKKPVNVGPPLNSRKRPMSAILASCNASDEIAAFASYNDSSEIRDTPGSYHNKKVKNAEIILGPVCPGDKLQPMTSSCPGEMVKKPNPVVAIQPQLTLHSRLSVTGFGHLKYDPKLFPSSHLQLSSPGMIAMPSVQTGQFQASLFGAFGQLRPLPQGPVLGIQSVHPDFGSIGGPKKASTDLEKRTTDADYYQITGAEQNFNVRSFVGSHLSRKRKECVLFQSPEALGENPKTMLKRKRIADKIVDETSKTAAVSLEQPKSKNDGDAELPDDVNPGSGILSEINTVTSMDLIPLQDNKGSQEISIFLRESSVVDEIIPSGIPIAVNELHQGNSTRAPQPGATKVSVLVENSVLSVTSALHKPDDADVFPADSPTQYGNKTTEAEKSARSMEQDDAGEEFCQRSLVLADDANVGLVCSAGNREIAGRDDQFCNDNMTAIVECAMTCVVPTENVSIMSLAAGSGAEPNLLPSNKSCAAKKDDVAKADHQVNTEGLSSNIPETEDASADGRFLAVSLPALKSDKSVKQSSEKIFAADKEHGVRQQDRSLHIVQSAAESSQSMDKSELTQLSSIDMSNSTEAEHGSIFAAPKDAEGTPMSKYVPSRTHDSCCSLLQRSLAVHKGIIADRPSDSMAVENLPFTKASPVWAQIEAMEIFTEVPQRPNFDQFRQHVPEVREGMALGLMFSFANLAESIKKLEVQDESALFEEKMNGLSSLEAHGFDVRHLRSRLEALLLIKNGRAEIQNAIKEVEEKIARKELDNRQLGTQIGMLGTTIRQLELHAHLLRCMMQSAVSETVNHALEISKLKAEARELGRSYLFVEERYGSGASAPWL